MVQKQKPNDPSPPVLPPLPILYQFFPSLPFPREPLGGLFLPAEGSLKYSGGVQAALPVALPLLAGMQP